MQNTCKQCGATFESDEKDQAFYIKFNVPVPKLCFNCRLQRRLAFRNEHQLYKDKCDLCQKNIISIFSPDKLSPVYCVNCYWSDKWDPMSYGFNFDFNQPFFEQFKKLYHSVPQLNVIQLGDNINGEFTHDVYRLKNCYLVFDGEETEDCYYGETFSHLKDCAEFLHLQESELCYECINCVNCYHLEHSRFCKNCSNSAFLMDCIGVKNSLGCVNLHQKEYRLFNQPYSKDEYASRLSSFKLDTYEGLENFKKQFETFCRQQPKQFIHGISNENVTGDNLIECKDTFDSFDCRGLRDCRYCTNMIMNATDCYDVDILGDRMSNVYNSACIGIGATNTIGCYYVCFDVADIFYSIWCTRGANNLFGCVGLRHKNYCILNKQYSKDDYEQLKKRLIEHMEQTGEWGEFFPTHLSLFCYNETVANLYFPLTEEQAIKNGYKWHKEEERQKYQNKPLPQTITETPQQICSEVLSCSVCSKGYKIIPQELALLRQLKHPLPHECFMCRHKARFVVRNPRKLWNRVCAKCQTSITTTYSSERPEAVYCKECYLQTVY